MFVSQESWQKRLIAVYGNQLILIDVTKYTLPLFFVCVKTNVDFLVVGQFITHFEEADSISEILGMLLSWDTSWSPRD